MPSRRDGPADARRGCPADPAIPAAGRARPAREIEDTTMSLEHDLSISEQPRAGEYPAGGLLGARSNRFFRLPNGWYFNTREQVSLGPFGSPERAEAAIGEFLGFLREAPAHVRRLFAGEHRSTRQGC